MQSMDRILTRKFSAVRNKNPHACCRVWPAFYVMRVMPIKTPCSNVAQDGSFLQSIKLAKPSGAEVMDRRQLFEARRDQKRGGIGPAFIAQAAPNRSLVIDDALHPQLFGGDTLLAVHAGSNAFIWVQPGVAALWIPVVGRTCFSTNGLSFVGAKGDVYASDSQRETTVEIGQKASCIAIVTRQKVWSKILDRGQNLSTFPVAVLPAVHSASLCVRRSLVRFVRESILNGNGCPANVSLLASSLFELQSSFDILIRRCPGPSISGKRAVFFRLQRAMNCIRFSEREYPSVSELAHMANYSVYQFIRVFSSVYGKTPHAHISSVLAERARKLLKNSDLAVGDVAAVLGIQSPATFRRIIKKNLGQSATSIRQARASQLG